MDRQTAAELLDNLVGMVDDTSGNDYDTALRMGIEALKTERHGKWIRCGWSLRCSKCGYDMLYTVRNYCPNCGAKMEVGHDNA